MNGLPSKYAIIDPIDLNKSLDSFYQDDENSIQRTKDSESVIPSDLLSYMRMPMHTHKHMYMYEI